MKHRKNNPNHRNEPGNTKRTPRRYACGTPTEYCTGTKASVQSSGILAMKTHGSPQECYQCEMRYWRLQGYSYIGGRMMQKENEPVVVLPRRMKAKRLKPGKEGRAMPDEIGNCGGLIR